MDLPKGSGGVKPPKRKKKKKKKKKTLGAFLESSSTNRGDASDEELASVMAVGTPDPFGSSKKKKDIDPAILARAEATTQKALKQKQVDDLAEKLIAEWTAKATAEKKKQDDGKTKLTTEDATTTTNWESTTTGAGISIEGQQEPVAEEEPPTVVESPETKALLSLGTNDPNEWVTGNESTSTTREPMGYRPFRIVSASAYDHHRRKTLDEIITEAMEDRTILWKGLGVLLGLYLVYQILWG